MTVVTHSASGAGCLAQGDKPSSIFYLLEIFLFIDLITFDAGDGHDMFGLWQADQGALGVPRAL
jgi:hypothetical protein